MIDLTMMRWRIERDYHELKQEVGLGHFEGREWRGFKELRVLKNVLSGCQPSSCVRRAAVVGLIWPGRQRVGGLCNSSISLSFGGPTEILISERHSPGAIQTRKVIMAGFAKRSDIFVVIGNMQVVDQIAPNLY